MTYYDFVATCPKGFWSEWIAEGDAAGDPETGVEWGWYTRRSLISVDTGGRFYVVAHGRLRGYAIITRVDRQRGIICRRGGAVAVTIPEPIRGFQGFRKRWWPYCDEIPFPDWRTP